ncbi:hypothetical protein GCM10010404_54420 [Nonomuraea africana]
MITPVGQLDDTTGQAAQLLGAQQAFLRRLDAAGAVRPDRSAGGQRRYGRRQLPFVIRTRELFGIPWLPPCFTGGRTGSGSRAPRPAQGAAHRLEAAPDAAAANARRRIGTRRVDISKRRIPII